MSTIDRRSVMRLGGIAAGLVACTAGTKQLALADQRTSVPIVDILEQFDERYRSRRIQGLGSRRRDRPSGDRTISVRIDGAELHVMTNADGSYTSVVNHYQSYPTLRQTARAAVDALRGAALRPVGHH